MEQQVATKRTADGLPVEVRGEMKIGEEDINHNAVRLIDELDVWDLTGDDMHDYQVMTLGYIKGVTEMAKALKEVLKA